MLIFIIFVFSEIVDSMYFKYISNRKLEKEVNNLIKTISKIKNYTKENIVKIALELTKEKKFDIKKLINKIFN